MLQCDSYINAESLLSQAFGEVVTQSLLFGSTFQGDFNPGSITRPVWAKATADFLLLTSVVFDAQVDSSSQQLKQSHGLQLS